MYELIGKPTTHTWVEERVVYRHYRHVTRMISAILRELKLKKMLRTVQEATKRAESLMKQAQELEDRSRPLSRCVMWTAFDVFDLIFFFCF